MKRSALLTTVCLLATVTAAAGASKKPATLKLAPVMEGITLEVKFENRLKLNVTTKGTRIAPGTYWVKSLRLFKKDKKGRIWEMRCTERFGSYKTITASAGQEKVLLLGPMFALRLFARQGKGANANIVNVRLSAAGVASESYYCGGYLNGKRAPAPLFKITTEEGKTLAAGRLKASGDFCTYTWHPPRGFKGSYRIEIKPTMGPFEWATRPVTQFKVE